LRERNPVDARIPESLWSQAVALAATHGVSKVAVTLRLDYNRLKRRVASGAPPPAPPSDPDFIELTMDLAPPVPSCTLVLSHPAGQSLRLAWTHPLASGEVAAVATRLWTAVA